MEIYSWGDFVLLGHWGDYVRGDFVRGDFVRGDLVRGDYVQGDFVRLPLGHIATKQELDLGHFPLTQTIGM